MPILGGNKAKQKGAEKMKRKAELESRVMEQVQVLDKSTRARSFSESGIGDSGDQDSTLKSQRIHSPLKS